MENILSHQNVKLHKIKLVNHQYSVYVDIILEKENFLYIWWLC